MVNELMAAGTNGYSICADSHRNGLFPSLSAISARLKSPTKLDDDPRTEGSPHRVNSPGHSLLIGTLPLPSDFPVAEFIAAELEMRARAGTSPVTPAPTWVEFSAAWMAVAYRFLDVTYFDQAFRD